MLKENYSATAVRSIFPNHSNMYYYW